MISFCIIFYSKYNFLGAPLSVEKPIVILEHSTFLLKWKSINIGLLPIKGHLIQAKRIAIVKKVNLFMFLFVN